MSSSTSKTNYCKPRAIERAFDIMHRGFNQPYIVTTGVGTSLSEWVVGECFIIRRPPDYQPQDRVAFYLNQDEHMDVVKRQVESILQYAPEPDINISLDMMREKHSSKCSQRLVRKEGKPVWEMQHPLATLHYQQKVDSWALDSGTLYGYVGRTLVAVTGCIPLTCKEEDNGRSD